MAIYRVVKKNNYTTILNSVLQDKRIGHKARGILVYLLSKPHGWVVNRSDLETHHDRDTAIRSGLRELRQSGYIKLVRNTDNQGRVVSWEYQIFEQPDVENPGVGFPDVDNQPLIKDREEEKNEKELNPPLDPPNGIVMKTIWEKSRNKQRTEELEKDANAVLDYLNQETNRHFRSYRQILKLLKGGDATLKECILVIDWINKCRRLYDRDWVERYLDNVTPFRADNFDKYRAKAEAWENNGRQVQGGLSEVALAAIRATGEKPNGR
jgi:hypothetical protein